MKHEKEKEKENIKETKKKTYVLTYAATAAAVPHATSAAPIRTSIAREPTCWKIIDGMFGSERSDPKIPDDLWRVLRSDRSDVML